MKFCGEFGKTTGDTSLKWLMVKMLWRNVLVVYAVQRKTKMYTKISTYTNVDRVNFGVFRSKD